MYPVYSHTERNAHTQGLYFVLHDQIEVWTREADSFASHNGGELHLFNGTAPIAVARVLGTGQIDTTATLMLYVQEFTPWVPAISQLHPLFTIHRQMAAVSQLLQNRPDPSQRLDAYRAWVWSLFDHAIEPEIRAAQEFAENCPIAHAKQIIHWLANKVDTLPTEMWLDAQYVSRKIVYQLANNIQQRLITQQDSYPGYGTIPLPQTSQYPDLNPAWRVVYQWGRVFGEHHSWAPVVADLLARRWRDTQNVAVRDHVIDWAHRHQLSADQIQFSMGLPPETINAALNRTTHR